MTIEPDTKDWTWVLREPCPECGLAAGEVPPTEVAGRIREDLPRWREVLRRDDAATRSDPVTWSPTEYACHVRDVHVLFAQRLRLILEQDDPSFANWNQDETAVADGYAAQSPDEAAAQLEAAGRAAADTWADVPGDAWQRQGRRSDGSVFTAATLGQYYLHDMVHHLHDVAG